MAPCLSEVAVTVPIVVVVANGTGSEAKCVPRTSAPLTVPQNWCPENNEAGLKAEAQCLRDTGRVQVDVRAPAEGCV